MHPTQKTQVKKIWTFPYSFAISPDFSYKTRQIPQHVI